MVELLDRLPAAYIVFGLLAFCAQWVCAIVAPEDEYHA
jgi:hypothetical protein